jgi:NAD(P)H-hydrate epimerase
MFTPLPTPEEISNWDRVSIQEYKIPGRVLMENASREAFRVLCSAAELEAKNILVLAGGGNNGGDAFCIARYLHDAGADVQVFHTRPRNKYSGETKSNLLLLAQLGIPCRIIPADISTQCQNADIIIDGLLGTGFTGELRPDVQKYVTSINACRAKSFVFSIDIPSGLNATTGIPSPEAVKAHITVTFEAAKKGLIQQTAKAYTGTLHICPIGIPSKVKREAPCDHFLITKKILKSLQSFPENMHKGTAGKVLIIGGSTGMIGAPVLAAKGALRAGSGLVSILVPQQLQQTAAQFLPEIMVSGAPCGDIWTKKALPTIRQAVKNFDVIVVGPGMGRHAETAVFFSHLLQELIEQKKVLVLDADALFFLAEQPELVQKLLPETILTPHPKEMARLCKKEIKTVQAHRIETARTFCKNFYGILVLKGAGTVVCKGQKSYICNKAVPNLAIGGSGDVLSGVIGSHLAHQLPPLEGTCSAVYRHALAGEILAANYPYRGNTAGEIADKLPFAVKEHRHD